MQFTLWAVKFHSADLCARVEESDLGVVGYYECVSSVHEPRSYTVHTYSAL